MLPRADDLARDQLEELARYPLLAALRGRRSRRFGPGMRIPAGPLAYESPQPPLPLTEDEQAALVFAACGYTGPALADLAYGPGQGGAMLADVAGRTIASADAISSVALIVIDDAATYLVKRPRDFLPNELPELAALAAQGDLAAVYRRSRVKLADGRCAPPVQPGYNFNINRWSLYAPGGTYFIPINELTTLYLNALLEAFDEATGLFILDERAAFRPAGIARFGRRKGGWLADDARSGRLLTIQALETALQEGVAVEQGMPLQNLGLMAQALGLGGLTNSAPHPFAWFDALGFRMGAMPASRFLGANRLISSALRLFRRDTPLRYPLGLERAGAPLLQPYCPPYYPSMRAAVEAVVARKFGETGVFRGGAAGGSWLDSGAVAAQIPAPSERAVAATIAYAEYVYARYGRFPAYSAPFRTVAGYQATHVETAFYDRFYRPEALTESQRRHMELWHAGG